MRSKLKVVNPKNTVKLSFFCCIYVTLDNYFAFDHKKVILVEI